MSERHHCTICFALAAALLIFGAAAVALPQLAAGREAQDAGCAWQSIGRASEESFHVAYALDSDARQLYVYGGMDKDLEAKSNLEAYDLSGPGGAASGSRIAVSGLPDMAGAAGAYRAKGKDADGSAVYFFGGLPDPSRGQATNQVQRYAPKNRSWERITPGNSTAFAPRAFAAAAYDPLHDVIWVTGGVANCSFTEVAPPSSKSCQARAIATAYLTFDPATGAPSWQVLSGGELSVFGHTLVYDPAGKRLLLFGGTNDIKTALGTVRALDLSDPDPAKASWSTLATAGTAPQLFFHVAALDTLANRMIVYGGVKRDFLQTNEQVNSGVTQALDLTTSPPQWLNLRPSGTPGDRVGAAMVYDSGRQAHILTVGRQKMAYRAQPTPTPPRPNPSLQSSVWGLTCGAPAPRDTLTPVPTSTATWTPTPEPTATFEMPTETATLPATEPPEPTATEEPTEEPTPEPTEEPTATEIPAAPHIYLPIAYSN